MKAVLGTEVTFETMTVGLGEKIDAGDNKAHHVRVVGYASHIHLWRTEDKERFEFSFIADEEFSKHIEALLVQHLGLQAVETFPHPYEKSELTEVK